MEIDKTSIRAKTFSLRTIVTFVMVGGLATGIQYSIVVFLVVTMSQPIVSASCIGFAISALINYLVNARVTFKSTVSYKTTAPKFFLTSGIGLLLTSVLISLFVKLKFPAVTAQILTTIGILIWNYSINCLWTFKKNTS